MDIYLICRNITREVSATRVERENILRDRELLKDRNTYKKTNTSNLPKKNYTSNGDVAW